MRYAEIQGRRVAYRVEGKGSPVILVHCSSASHKQWRDLAKVLRASFRVYSPDLSGYGESEKWAPHKPFDPFFDVRILHYLIQKAGAPVHLVGHSYGGAMALEAARFFPSRIKSLTLIEPVAFHLLQKGDRMSEYKIISRIGRRVVEANRRGSNVRATRTYMGFWLGKLKWALMPRSKKDIILSTIDKVALEYGAIDRMNVPLSEYAKIGAPTRLIQGAKTQKPARAILDILYEAIPRATRIPIRGAGHMSPITHAAKVLPLIIEHIETCESLPMIRRCA